MNNLIIESKAPINFFTKGSVAVLGVVEASILPVTNDALGGGLVANYKYFGYVGGVRTLLASGTFELDETEMNAAYDLIKGGIDPSDSLSVRNVYLYSTTLISEAVTKFVGINVGLTASDFQIKAPLF